MQAWLFIVAVLLGFVGQADALQEPQICYILDAILFVYGIVLTVLYCHLKMKMRRMQEKKGSQQQALYEPLQPADKQVYSEIPAMGQNSKQMPNKKEEGVYQGLHSKNQETYETLQMQDKPK